MARVIYKPRGRAREYSPLALNLYRGCSHGCTYCYAPGCMHTTSCAWHSTVTPREGLLKKLEADAREMEGDPRRVLLCFLSDPYQPADDVHQLTRQALEILGRHRMKAQILTKGGTRACRDFDLMRQHDVHLGVSLSFVTDEARAKWEPEAASVEDRVELLRRAHRAGIYTWVSVEPVILPDEALAVIRRFRRYVRFWKVGKLNHMRDIERGIDWPAFRGAAVKALDRAGADYYIKKDLLAARATP